MALEPATEATTAPPKPAERAAVSGPPAEPPVVPAATSAEKQEVVAPAVSAQPGDDASERARTFDALGRTEDAIAQYERAVQLLSPDDPNRKTVEQRLDVLRAGIIE